MVNSKALLFRPSKEDIETIRASELFDADWYLENYPDVKFLGMDPAEHYLWLGAKLNRDPSPYFNTSDYLASNDTVLKDGVNPLLHYILSNETNHTSDERSAPAQDSESPADGDAANAPGRGATKSSQRISGKLRVDSRESPPIITGWLAKIGDNTARIARVIIEQDTFEVVANSYASDLQQNKINQGWHAFSIAVPQQFVDGRRKTVKLIDRETGVLIATATANWSHSRSFYDFAGFLSASMVSPVVHAPFREADKRCFATMEGVARQLLKKAFSLSPRPLVSVIMPVHNRVETVAWAVQSVLRQQYEHFELIIVDDGSQDGSFELTTQIRDPRITVLRNETSMGVSVARNKCLQAASGAYIAYLDSDNFWDDRFLAAMVGAFAERPDAESMYSGQLLFRGDNIQPFAARYGHFNRALLENRNYIDLNAFCHTIGMAKQLGGFDESLSRFVDYDLILRASEQGTIVSVPVLLSHYYYDKAARTITNDSRLAPQIDVVWTKMQQRAATVSVPIRLEGRQSKVSVVIPSYQSLDDIGECLQSLFDLQLDWVEVVVVDNASDTHVREFLSNLCRKKKLKLIQNEVNFGFTYAVNQGIAASSVESDILIINNDAIVTPGAIQEMQFQMYRLDNAGIVVPRQVLPGGTATITQHVPFAHGDRDCDVNLSAHHRNIVNPPLLRDGGPVELSFAPFFCAYILRDCLRKADNLDAEYGRHYRSDRLFCDFVRHILGRKIYYVPNAIVHHKLQKSTNALRVSDKSTFDVMFRRNEWDEDTARTLGYRRPAWNR